MSKLIYIDPDSLRPSSGPVKTLYKLRWRLKIQNGVEVYGPWTPEVRFPSLSMTIAEFHDRIENVYIDCCSIQNPEFKRTLFSCSGSCFLDLKYLAGLSLATNRSRVEGFTLADRDGCKYHIRIDGSCYQER